jgi:hypothetical protein
MPALVRLPAPQIDSAITYAGQLRIVTGEDSPFPFQASPAARRDSSVTAAELSLILRPAGTSLSVLAQLDSGPVNAFLTVDSLGNLQSDVAPDSTACVGTRQKEHVPSPLVVALLVPARDPRTGNVTGDSRTRPYQSCLGSTLLRGDITVLWEAAKRLPPQTVELRGTLSGALASDSGRALPARVMATLGGSVTLEISANNFSPSNLDLRLEISYRVTNARIDQSLRQVVHYVFTRTP